MKKKRSLKTGTLCTANPRTSQLTHNFEITVNFVVTVGRAMHNKVPSQRTHGKAVVPLEYNCALCSTIDSQYVWTKIEHLIYNNWNSLLINDDVNDDGVSSICNIDQNVFYVFNSWPDVDSKLRSSGLRHSSAYSRTKEQRNYPNSPLQIIISSDVVQLTIGGRHGVCNSMLSMVKRSWIFTTKTPFQYHGGFFFIVKLIKISYAYDYDYNVLLISVLYNSTIKRILAQFQFELRFNSATLLSNRKSRDSNTSNRNRARSYNSLHSVLLCFKKYSELFLFSEMYPE